MINWLVVGFQSFANGLFYCSADHNRSVRFTVMGGIQKPKRPFVSYCSAELSSKSINRKQTCGDKFLCYRIRNVHVCLYITV